MLGAMYQSLEDIIVLLRKDEQHLLCVMQKNIIQKI